MITIDKLCYTSKLRYENAGEVCVCDDYTSFLCNESFHRGRMHCFSSHRDSHRL